MATELSVQRKKTKTAIIDCDIHHNIAGLKDLYPYLSKKYRDQIDHWGDQLPLLPFLKGGGVKGRRNDSFPENGRPAAGDLDFLQKQLLDEYNIRYGILTGQHYRIYASQQVEYAEALCAAHNDWTIDQWLDKCDKLRASIFVPIQDPLLAAKEIDRMAKDKRMVQVITVSGARMPYGQRFYYPIYEKCVEYNLPFAIHVGYEGDGIFGTPTSVGYPSHYAEWKALRPPSFMAHLASFIYEGVFERFPTLKVGLIEGGFYWVAPFLWKMDHDWKSLHTQVPWLKKPPSEYYKSNVFIGSQPVQETPEKEIFVQHMEWLNAKDNLVFCSDYPHWDFDSPTHAFPAKLDPELRNNIFYNNASKLYKLPPLDEVE
ncbi:amidohydrolase family protein [Brevibacillus sp. B_LB10_24]|uniref:amidohydrolase family protein n=1 Tax=Brevibacillus sp. B_LB10_24 TaxID=3380645 RepID=UPI0038B8F9FA